MPQMIALYNGMGGGPAGTLLTQLMAKAMNRSMASVPFKRFGVQDAAGGTATGTMKAIGAADVALKMSCSMVRTCACCTAMERRSPPSRSTGSSRSSDPGHWARRMS